MGRMSRVGRRRGWSMIVALLGSALVVGGAGPAGAAKLQKACTVLTPDQIETVIGIPIADPDGAGSKAGCSFDIGDGIGEPGGGLVITQYQTGPVAKNLWSSAKRSQQKVGKTYWDPASGIASAYRNGKLFAVSITITGTDDADHQADAVALATLGAKKL